MMLTSKGRYAVSAIIDIAIHSNGKPVNLSDVSNRQHIALNYLEQIFVMIKAKGIVSATRGPGGGYLLSKSPNDIKISQIIDAVEETIDITRCSKVGHLCINKNQRCITHDLWNGLGKNIRSYLDNVSILDVIEGRV